jgi:uncharacterized protein YbjT (DUF2867 family)
VRIVVAGASGNVGTSLVRALSTDEDVDEIEAIRDVLSGIADAEASRRRRSRPPAAEALGRWQPP